MLNEAGFAPLPLPHGWDESSPFPEVAVPYQVEGVPLIQTLEPRESAAAPPNTYSGIYGRQKFPLHTDLATHIEPPRYLFMRCMHPDVSVPTLLLDGAGLVSRFGESALSRTLVRPRRPSRGQTPVFSLFETRRKLLRYDEAFLRPASLASKQIIEQFRKDLQTEPEVKLIFERLGDGVVIDNWRMLHGRGPIPDGGSQRKLVRTYARDLT